MRPTLEPGDWLLADPDAYATVAPAVGDLVLGLAGFWFGLRQAALQTVEEPGLYLLHLVSWLHGGAALLIVAFLGAVLVALLWFIISSRVARIEEAEVAYLLEG